MSCWVDLAESLLGLENVIQYQDKYPNIEELRKVNIKYAIPNAILLMDYVILLRREYINIIKCHDDDPDSHHMIRIYKCILFSLHLKKCYAEIVAEDGQRVQAQLDDKAQLEYKVEQAQSQLDKIRGIFNIQLYNTPLTELVDKLLNSRNKYHKEYTILNKQYETEVKKWETERENYKKKLQETQVQQDLARIRSQYRELEDAHGELNILCHNLEEKNKELEKDKNLSYKELEKEKNKYKKDIEDLNEENTRIINKCNKVNKRLRDDIEQLKQKQRTDICNEFINNPERNPISGKLITKTGDVYKLLDKACK